MRIQKIIKHGNALAVVIPVQQLRELGLKRGEYVELRVGPGRPFANNKQAIMLYLWKVKP